MIGNAMIALQRYPDQKEKLLQDPSLWPRAIDELLRYDGSVQMTNRAALEDVCVDGTPLGRGEIVFLCLGAANRDPDRFEDADCLRIERAEHGARLLTFGGGVHYCLGARLALIELEVALRAWYERMPNFTLNLAGLSWRTRHTLRGVRSLEAVRSCRE
jgi:hypothetical protein